MRSAFLSVQSESDPSAALRAKRRLGVASRFDVVPSTFRAIPRSPFAYWVSDYGRSLFTQMSGLQTEDRGAFFGASTKDDFRYLRTWFELRPENAALGWLPHAKGGPFSKYFRDIDLLLDWRRSGANLKAFVSSYRNARGWGDQWTGELKGSIHYHRPGLTWARRTTGGLGFNALPAGSIFGDKGPAVLVEGDKSSALLALLALANSTPFQLLVEIQMSSGSYEVGVIQRTPVPNLQGGAEEALSRLARRGWSLRRSLDTCSEVSHAFVMPAVLQVEGTALADRVGTWSGRVADIEAELDWLQSEVDELCFKLYGISDEDRSAISEGLGVTDSSVDEGSAEEVGDDVEPLGADPRLLAAGLVSWAVGVGVGRFDVRLATGDRELVAEPDPFDPLPNCSPSMLTGEDDLPVDEPPLGYPVPVSPVLVNDRGHEFDITGRVRAVFDEVFGVDADSWWTDAGEALGGRRGEISTWLRKGFFEHHLKSYSKSRRRKAPILWPLGTSSGSYVVWLYAHRTTADSLFQVLNDIVVPKLRAEQRHLTELIQEAGPNPSAGQREAIDVQETLVGELRELRDELEAVTPFWVPDLDDGIVIILAPLWRLFAHHRPWSRELKGYWDKLTLGVYDWAQLAMHLWPERVVPKCAEDRSLAIAHGLEDEFWFQDPDNDDKWHPRPTPTTPIDQLVAERHKPATKAALQQVTR